MKSILLLLMAAIYISPLFGQHTFQAIIKDKETLQPLVVATAVLEEFGQGAVTNAEGMVELKDIPDGQQTIVFAYLGYEERQEVFEFPLTSAGPIEIFLVPDEEALEEVII